MKDLVGKRLLMRYTGYNSNPVEVLLLEVSPSGEHFKLRFSGGTEGWYGIDQFRLLEVLPPTQDQETDYEVLPKLPKLMMGLEQEVK